MHALSIIFLTVIKYENERIRLLLALKIILVDSGLILCVYSLIVLVKDLVYYSLFPTIRTYTIMFLTLFAVQ